VRTLIAALITCATAQVAAGQCSEQFDSTFAAVQEMIFERRGCTSVTCHSGAMPAGGLDLSPAVAWRNLIDVPPQSVATAQHPGLARVVPGNKKRSLLWLNLAAATLPSLWQAPVRPMPQGGLAPLTSDELALVQLWIEYGATRDGVVPGSGELVDACLPPPEPLKTQPLAPPPPGVGVQIRSPRQVLAPQSERETCFVSYFDFSDQVPEEFRGFSGDTFRYKRVDARQDPLSHHGVVIVYQGAAPIDSPVWGPFACRGGARDGQPCAPRDRSACGADAICASPPVPSVACIGYGPGDAGIGTGEDTLFSTMSSAVDGIEGIYEEAPLRGILVWNSHAFNVTPSPATLDMWVNFEFAAPAEQLHRLDRFVDVSAIAKMNVPAFAADEVCSHHVLPAGVQVTEFVSHTHKRGKRFRVFAGDFHCQSGPRVGDPCSPFGPDLDFATSDPCAGAPCVSKQPPRACDCNADLQVSIEELVLAVQLALDQRTDSCPRADGDGDGAVSVADLIAGVASALGAPLRDADDSLLYTSLTYADPLVLNFSPPRSFGGPHSLPAERTLTYCALYDNGFSNPDEVKRASRVPTNAQPCRVTHCAAGAVGRTCARDEDCDSRPAAADGDCDACSVGFGVSTDDEMFVLIGSYVRAD
jgi:predicted CxxxxCH...CXXCH cytochrome family protein